MNRTPVCREFLRGSCRFGSRCKFSHNASQPQRQQTSNPFGFGVKNQGQQQPKGGNYYSPLASQKQDKNQSQVAVKDHRCNDPKECRQQIKEDLEHELPVFWRLTCYAHGKFLPNDIVGDVSFEELRANEYSAGKQGMSFDSVVQNEKSMFAAKKKEFDFLLNNPYSGPASSGRGDAFTSTPLRQEASKMSFGAATPALPSSPFSTSNSLTGPTGLISGFGGVKEPGGFSFGLGAPLGSTTAGTAPISVLPQTAPAPGFSFGMQPSETRPFAMQALSPQNVFSSSSQPFTGFGQNSLNFCPTIPTIGNPSPGGPQNLFGSSNPFQAANETEMSDSLLSLNQTNMGVKDLGTSMTPVVTQLTNHMPAPPFSQQYGSPPSDTKADIWLKANWDLGEIPEEEPPLYAR